ncbi:bola-like protein [Marasmius fiardii PR-910]|nr:bola-like protein [Marasmius fiardii PR-910]
MRLPLATIRRSFVSRAPQIRRFSRTSIHSHQSPPSKLSDGEQNIYAKLTEKFSPSQLQVQDVSGGCGSFYAITIASEAFKGLTMVKQHRLVTETLKKEITGIHGLQMSERNSDELPVTFSM